jgi:hypothetical protein
MYAAGLVLAAVSWYFESARAQQTEFDIDENIDGKQGFLFPESLVSDTDSLAGHTTYRLIAKTKIPYITSIYGVCARTHSTVDENRPAESMRRCKLRVFARTLTRGGSLLQRCTVTRQIP